jgi:hypothetical protein
MDYNPNYLRWCKLHTIGVQKDKRCMKGKGIHESFMGMAVKLGLTTWMRFKCKKEWRGILSAGATFVKVLVE